MQYKVGDNVRIVKKWNNKTNQNKYGEMDKWLGKVMTVGRIMEELHGEELLLMIEDEGKWLWNEACIEGLVKDLPKIVITTDGTETLARLYEGGKVVKSATAKCHPQDAFDAVIGAKIAFDRLIGEEKTEPKEQKWRVVKRPARAGDYIRLVKKVFSFNKIGDILKVFSAMDNCVSVKEKDHPRKPVIGREDDYRWNYLNCFFEVVEPVGTPEMPEEPKCEYKKGDSVIIAETNIDCKGTSYKGEIGVIEDIDTTYHFPYAVKTSKYTGNLWCKVSGYAPKYFSGKAVCVKGDGKYFTVGKIYEFVDGKTKDDAGHERPHGYRVDSTFETLKKDTGGRFDFLPIVE